MLGRRRAVVLAESAPLACGSAGSLRSRLRGYPCRYRISVSKRGLSEAPALTINLLGCLVEKAPAPVSLTTDVGSKGRAAPPSKRGLGGAGLGPFQCADKVEGEILVREKFSGAGIFHIILSEFKKRDHLQSLAM